VLDWGYWPEDTDEETFCPHLNCEEEAEHNMSSIENIQRAQFEKCVVRAHEFDDKGLVSMDEWLASVGERDVQWELTKRLEKNAKSATATILRGSDPTVHLCDVVNLALLLLCLERGEG
jgi:hypothetical protein